VTILGETSEATSTRRSHAGGIAPWARLVARLVGEVFRVIEARPTLALGLVGMLFAAAYLVGVFAFPAPRGRIINGDAIQYYAYLRSAAIDHDLDFTNDYTLLYGSAGEATNAWLTTRTPVGRPTNLMSVGPAILWAPFYLATFLLLGAVRAAPLTGLEPALQASVGIAGICYATMGACLSYRACALLFPRAASFWATVVAWLGGSAVYYSLVSPTYSHATSMCAVALFVYAWLRTRDGVGLGRMALLGALGGLATLVRWQDAVVMLLPIVEVARAMRTRRLTMAASLARVVVLGMTAAVTVSPQLFAWQAIYGTPLLIPQGGGFMRWSQPAVGSVLFSLRHGLFTWTPALLAAAIGLPVLVNRDRRVGWPVVAVLALTVYANAAAWDWWAGEAFGARRFVGSVVFFAMGIAAWFATSRLARRPMVVRWLSLGLVTYNVLFLLQYQLFMRGMVELVPYPTTVPQVFVDRLWLPFHLVARWLWP
jgi:hypothetical protein